MADVTITHTRAEGTILTGSVKGDGVFEIVRHHGFWFSKNVEGLFIKRSRDREAPVSKINAAAVALRLEGHTVTVDIRDKERRSFAEAEAERVERAEDRAERAENHAGKAAARSEVRHKAAHAIANGIPAGQPILVGHHSEGSHRRAIARMDGHMRASIEEDKKAGYWANRAKAAEGYEAFRNNPQRTLRRLERLGADLRRQKRYRDEEISAGRDASLYERRIEDLNDEIAYWRKIVEEAEASGVKLWGPDDFVPGDFVRYSGSSWYEVKRVNPKTLSIAWNLRLAPKQVMTCEDATLNGRVNTHPADYTQVHARCPGEAMRAFLADGKVPGAKWAAKACEEQPASVLREAMEAKKGKKRRAPKAAEPPAVPEGQAPQGNGEASAEVSPVERTAELDAAYRAYVDNVIASTDDWCPPLDFQEWASTLGASLAAGEAGPEQTATDAAPEASPKVEADAEKTAPTSDFSAETRNRTAESSVGNSDYPLTSTPTEGAVTEEEKYGRRLTRRERKAAQLAEVQERAAQRPEIERTVELDAAYRRYVDDGIASTDGWYAPLDFQAWASTLGAHLVAAAAGEAAEVVEEGAVEAADPAEEVAPEASLKVEVDAEKTALTSDFSAETRNRTAESSVGNSDYPLNLNTQEAPAMTATRARKTAKTALAPKASAPAEVKTVQKIVPIDRIDRDESQPRKVFDQAKLEELAGSIKELGLLQPVSLRYVASTKRYTLVMGERRWRAAQMAGLTEMLAVVSHGVQDGARETLARQVAENVGRADMTPIEEAESFQRLVEADYSIDEVAKMVGKSPAYVGWRIDLLRLCEPAREALAKGHLPVGLSWYVSLLNCDNQMRFLARYSRGEFKSTRDAEAFAQAARAEEKRVEEQGSFFVLADEATERQDSQESLPGSLDLPEGEREKLVDDRRKLVGKIDKLSVMGEILSELASADPETLAVLLAGTPGGVPGHQLRIEHLRELTLRAHKNLRQAQAIAAVRASSIQINPEAASTSSVA